MTAPASNAQAGTAITSPVKGSSMELAPAQARIHGGVDALGAAHFDFSTNSNACGPCAQALDAVQRADSARYPDPGYTVLRQRLADLHGVQPWRVVLAGSASEFIFRFTAQAVRAGAHSVWIPPVAYGDYGHAAQAWGLQHTAQPQDADLLWACVPSSPLGQVRAPWPVERAPVGLDAKPGGVVVDCAYAPLRLQAPDPLQPAYWGDPQGSQYWTLWSPNKALGLTGVRGAYAIAPANSAAQGVVQRLQALAPSWPVGAHGVAMLQAWTAPSVQAWVAQSLYTLAGDKAALIEGLTARGWEFLPSDTHYFCARPQGTGNARATDPAALRAAGIKLRDTTSMGLPGWWRLSAQGAAARRALFDFLEHAS